MTPNIHPYPAYKPSGVPWLGEQCRSTSVERLAHPWKAKSTGYGEVIRTEPMIYPASVSPTLIGGSTVSGLTTYAALS